jgi:hypothetical protein
VSFYCAESRVVKGRVEVRDETTGRVARKRGGRTLHIYQDWQQAVDACRILNRREQKNARKANA